MDSKATGDLRSQYASYPPVDFRLEARRAEEERACERLRELELQTAATSSPEERIRVWERRHALGLPRSGTHPLVKVIAVDTQLTVRAVNDEQRRRVTPNGLGTTDA